MSIINAKLYVIEKTIEWITNLMQFSSNIWIFTDSQKSINLIENENHCLIDQIYQNSMINQSNHNATYIHWILDHADISKNKKTDALTNFFIFIDSGL